MKLSQFDYTLPSELIAQYPAQHRADSRMLVLDRKSGTLTDSQFKQLPDFIDSSYFLVLNDSRVFKARLLGQKRTGGKVEIFLVRRDGPGNWIALLRPSGRVKKGELVFLDARNAIKVMDDPGPVERLIAFETQEKEEYLISYHGRVPLPPYIKREPDADDVKRYQTVYARTDGSVAAPTAGLHFDRRMLTRIEGKGIGTEYVTLHVGPGTFKPVVADEIEKHVIDPEYATISYETAETINRSKLGGKKLLAVGTTAVRTLEYATRADGNLREMGEMVDIFIYPPYRFKIVDALLTNFHLPKSSLLMLVAAFCGHDFLFEAYRHAVKNKYRFYSYGDCMLIL